MSFFWLRSRIVNFGVNLYQVPGGDCKLGKAVDKRRSCFEDTKYVASSTALKSIVQRMLLATEKNG
jgi:hypothetical protein